VEAGALIMKNKIREFRARTKMTQDELADKAKVSRQTINAIENDKYDPSLPLAFSLAKAFKVRIEELFVP
jgi:putative transcriptional regulator